MGWITVLTCDICGRSGFHDSRTSVIELRHDAIGNNHKKLFACPDCGKEINEFIEELKNTKEETP